MIFKLYVEYWKWMSNWAQNDLIKQQVTLLGIPFIIQILLGGFFTLTDLG